MTSATNHDLVGRETELAQLHRFVQEVSDGPCGLLLRGEAGIGKTALWRSGIEAAEGSGIRVLETRCVEAELPLALGGMCDLLDGAFEDAADGLAEPQRHALAVTLGLEAPDEEPPERLALPRGFVAFVRVLAAHGPVLLAIDDVQWLDAPSQRVVAYACNRLVQAPVGILATHRGDAGDALGLRHALDDRFAEMRLPPLGAGALHHLVRTRLGVRIPRATMARVQAASGGNPMFALEFAQVAATADGPLPLPSSLEELIRDRVAALPGELLPLLAAAAAAERPTLSRLEPVIENAEELVHAASAAAALTLGADGVVRFTHPLLGSAAYAAASPSTRRELHARLASSSTDPEERARHVALSTSGPDADAARLLDEAAARARSRGAPDAAATLAQHALRLTPPTDLAGHDERALAIADYLTDAGQATDARILLDGLISGPMTADRRARALLMAAMLEPGLEQRSRLAEEALDHAGDNSALRAHILLIVADNQIAYKDFATAEETTEKARAIAENLGDPVLLTAALSVAAFLNEHLGRSAQSLLERAVTVLGTRAPLLGFHTPRNVLGQFKLMRGDIAGARELLEADLEATRRRGQDIITQRTLGWLFDLEYAAGRWPQAERYLDEQAQLAFDGDDPFGTGFVHRRQALLAAGQGREDEARRLAYEAIAFGEVSSPPLAGEARGVLGFLAISLDNPADACEALRFVIDIPLASADTEPFHLLVPTAPDAIEALVTVGRLDDAERLLSRLEAYARERGQHRWAMPAASRCRALLLLARRDSEAALAAAEEAASGFADAGYPLDRGRALLVAGEALRRLGKRRRAAEKLEAAREIFAQLGAPLWLARAENELSRARPRPRRDSELTAAETRVAALVAAGHTNPEVAAQLFTTVGTVEVHLTRIYRKLGLRSRTELARLVADGTLQLPER